MNMRVSMQLTGSEYLASLRDGRTIYLGGETVRDVTTHPAFRNAAHSFARLYDAKRDPRNRDVLTYEEGGERHAFYWLMPRSREDLVFRAAGHRHLSDMSYGMLGRSPDYFSGFVVGLAMTPEIFKTETADFSQNILAYREYCRDRDIFVSNAVTPPAGTRERETFVQRGKVFPALRVVRETDSGVVISGMKLLATSAPFAHELFLGNIQPLAPGMEKEAITCAIPMNSPGLTLWSRKSFEKSAVSEIDNPLSTHFDETDCVIVCEDVEVPWERVFVHGDIELSSSLYYKTAAHSLGNHQATIRFRSKLMFLTGLAERIAVTSGTSKFPAVQETLAHMAALDGMISAMIQGQIHDYETLANGFVNINRRAMYAAIYWCYLHYDDVCARLRELMGGGVMQMPADISVMDDPHLRQKFESYWSTTDHAALDRFKLYKLAWDAVGTEFAGRHMLYERFYLGPIFIARGHSSREAPWHEMRALVDTMLDGYGYGDVPAAAGQMT
ncbi:4-hydroxyphenylacetate 3-hydroxylase family protein [Rhizobium lusitanum]|uniref:4-hydroxyphenylacetate 3-hydroxylase family protein n=1 Tax=Rhizobium lusitanum TaxID=293958 RepID=UPI001958DD89|nr:4-hydroxyphenylacetate 3-hydroxylase N-terminal domain-containing protein [Rhizobium lusitanum]MBM7049228.1 hypothetical protein [Rhizobium lusitanum]